MNRIMNTEISVRLANLGDVQAIAEISERYEPKGIDKYIKSLTDQIKANAQENSLTHMFVAELKEEVIAHANLFFFDKAILRVKYDSPSGWYLNGVIVDEKYRRLGAAKSLSLFREKYIAGTETNKVIYSIVSAENIPSIEYHKGLNFIEAQRAEGFLDVKLKCGEGILFSKQVGSFLREEFINEN